MLIKYLLGLMTFGNATFDPENAPILVNVANTYLTEHSRLIFDIYGVDTYFATLATKGHNTSIVFGTPPLPPIDEIIRVMGHKCDVILIHRPFGALPSNNEWRALRWNPGGRVLVITEGSEAVAQRIIRTLWIMSKTRNVVVAILKGKDIQFYTWTPYLSDECSEVKAVIMVDEWKDGRFVQNKPLFVEKKIETLNGCEVIVTTKEVEPFVITGRKDGIEMQILFALASQCNFRVRFEEVPANEVFWLATVGNETHPNYRGAFKLLYNQQVDMAFAGVTAHTDRYSASLPLFPHFIERLIWIIPAPVIRNPIYNTFRALSPLLWIMLVVSLGVSSVAVLIIKDPKSADYPTSFFYTLGVILNGMPPVKTKNWYLRIVTFFTIYLAIHFFIAYQSSLIYLLTNSLFERQYQHVEELAADGLHCLIYSGGEALFRNIDNVDDFIPKDCVLSQDWFNRFKDVAYSRSTYILFLKTPTDFILWRKYEDGTGRNLIEYLREPFMVLPISIYMSPGHPLAELFNKVIQRLVESGLVTYWEARLRKYNTVGKIRKRKMGVNHDHSLKPLSPEHLVGAFTTFYYALIFSFIVFLVEQLFSTPLLRRKAKNVRKSIAQKNRLGMWFK